jgi:6-pyruvoyltetrahydropterin/6-carboxytetrahydropterin synthase
MIIRKLFTFEASHLVRNCSSARCKYSMHGHSFKAELFLEAARLDRGQMVYDFGLLKGPVRDLFDSFDHAFLFWVRDDEAFRRSVKAQSRRWIELPVSPTAEQLSRTLFVLADAALKNTRRANGDHAARVHSVILHETATGYAQCFRKDAYSRAMGPLPLKGIVFSDGIRREWSDPSMWDRLLAGRPFVNPAPDIQVP